MPVLYPAQIDNSSSASLGNILDNVSVVSGSNINTLRDVAIAIENALGAAPYGAFGTVKARLDNVDAVIASIQAGGGGGGGGSGFIAAHDLAGTPTSQLVIGLQGRAVSGFAPSSGQSLVWNGSSWFPTVAFNAGTDLAGTTINQTVVGFQGRSFSAAAPATNNAIMWSGTQWQPTAITTSSILANLHNTAISYTVAPNDDVIVVDTTTSATTITLLSSPSLGYRVRVKDQTGHADTHNITVVGSGGNTIDFGANYTIAIQFGILELLFTGSGNWSVV